MSFLSDLWNSLFNRPTPPSPTPTTVPSSEAQELLTIHNKERGTNRLPPLRLNESLTRAAQKHASWMAINHTLDHSENGVRFDKRLTAEGYHFWSAGENIAMGQPTPQAVMQSWMNSPGHRANILKAGYKDVGFGVATSSGGQRYWCVDFGSQSAGIGMENIHEPGVFLSGPLGPTAGKIAIDHLT